MYAAIPRRKYAVPGITLDYLKANFTQLSRLAGLGIAVAKKADTRFPMKGFMAADTGGFLRIRITIIGYASHIL